jgi:hypothetical protein
MTLPAGYRDWCLAHGINPYHPDEWTPEQLQRFRLWKTQHVMARKEARMADGTWWLYSDDQQLTLLRDDLAMLEAPPPTQPWAACPCHAKPPQGADDQRLPEDRVTDAERAAWVAVHPFIRAGLERRTQACLAWMALTFGRRMP